MSTYELHITKIKINVYAFPSNLRALIRIQLMTMIIELIAFFRRPFTKIDANENTEKYCVLHIAYKSKAQTSVFDTLFTCRILFCRKRTKHETYLCSFSVKTSPTMKNHGFSIHIDTLESDITFNSMHLR